MADHQRPKRLNEMDDLRDMGRFPVSINILPTIVWTYLLQGRYRQRYVLLLWAASSVRMWCRLFCYVPKWETQRIIH